MNWYVDVLKKYFVFHGRATRTEYWMFTLVNFLIWAVLRMIDIEIITGLYSLAVLLPSLGVFVRRLHDTDRTGWWFFLGLIPVVGAIVLIVFLAQDSQPGENKYGPNPKGANGVGPDVPAAPASVVEATPAPEPTPEPVVEESIPDTKEEEVVVNDLPVSESETTSAQPSPASSEEEKPNVQ